MKKSKNGSFQSLLGLESINTPDSHASHIINGLNRMGYKLPTPIQRKTIPLALAGIDLVCMARTGSGKTCAFLLPLVFKLEKHNHSSGVRGIVLSPTRELAVQTFKFARDIAKFTDLNIINILGGDPIEAQFEALSSRPDIIIATPGRLMHHLREISTFKLKQVQLLIFDEADRLFEMGFAEQLNEIVRECPVERQTLLFSATMPKQLVQFSRAGLRDPQLIRLDTDSQLSTELRLAFFMTRSNEKIAAFLYLVQKIIPATQVTIVFTATRHHSELIHALLERIGISSTMVYGTMDQDARSMHLKAFRGGSIRYLIVTDLAARGIDVPLLNNVINFHFPPSPKLFIHRCGRAARQGRIGYAFSLVESEELAFVADVHAYLGRTLDICSKTGSSNDDGDELHAVGSRGDDAAFMDDEFDTLSYTLETMSPSQVHVGVLPQDVLDRENDFLKRCLADDDELSTMYRISENGMKQYRRTRTEASRSGVKVAKALLKDSVIREIHPLIVGCDPQNCGHGVVQKNDFVRMLQTFRPSQTVFETGIGTGTGSGYNSKVNGGSHPQLQSAKMKLVKGAEMMKALRAVTAMSLERNRQAVKKASNRNSSNADDHVNQDDQLDGGASICSAGDGALDEFDGDSDCSIDNECDEYYDSSSVVGSIDMDYHINSNNSSSRGSRGSGKVRLSIAEKKKLKKKGVSHQEMREMVTMRSKTAVDGMEQSNTSHSLKRSRSGGEEGSSSVGHSMSVGLSDQFRDTRHYMSYGDEDVHASFAEESMQPQSGLRSSESISEYCDDVIIMKW